MVRVSDSSASVLLVDVSEKLPVVAAARVRLMVWDVVLGCFFVLADDSEFELAFDSSLLT